MLWAKLYLNQTDLAQTVSSTEVKITLGDQDDAAHSCRKIE